MDHVHIGGIQFIIFGLQLILWLFAFRWLETKFHDNAAGRGLAYIH